MKETHHFADRLRAKDILTGTLVSLPSPEICELLCHVGYDWLFIDAEHGAFNPQQAQSMLQAASPTPCVIRVPVGETIWLKKALDIGAAGVIIPQVHNSAQAREIIKHCKYSPIGDRGIGIGRAHKYGIEFERYLENANDEIAVILQAESAEAVEHINDIVNIKGVDAILVGPYDLSASLGMPGQIDHPRVQSAIDKIVTCCKEADISMGFFGVSSEAVLPYKEKGFTLLTVGVDTTFIIKSASQTLSEMND
ncbi:MAG: 2,4-dihydroxyhept-2-ene-1,7-dioic acid aldolase [Proteobacteria bacterium]|nr:2,4-dihydroxyhept-2-ene-1,7-dioic acid aldolase [Pseudomonadota bacterium]NOG59655.1 2,4-dihydroxyhept-2-ene-1,7-dioic acid aldolase [Pseudomonadota bacterium]